MTKIVLSASRDIPLNKLVLSQANVRRIKAGVSVEELAEDIARRGLLQSLSVRPVRGGQGEETGTYEVPAGGRRFQALQLLVKQKRLAKTGPVPCLVKTDGIAEEDSLAENTMREALHPLDQFRAFQALRDEHGLGDEEIAARFFVTPAVVRQRLKLVAVGSCNVHLIFGSLAAVGLSATITAWLSVGAQGLSLLSAGLLFWFAIKISQRTVVMGLPRQRREGWLRSYVSALAFGLSNPVTVVLLAACLPSLTISDDPKAIPALISGVFLGSVAWWILLSATVSLVRHRLSARALTLTNKASGLALAGLGALMLASAFGLKLN